MKKKTAIVLASVLFVLIAAGGFYFLSHSPDGVLRPVGSDDVMQSCMDSMDEISWRSLFCSLTTPSATEFESADEIARLLFDETSGDFTFRREPNLGGTKETVYVVSRGEDDLLLARLRFEDRAWSEPEFSAANALKADTRTLSITVPAGSLVEVNGIELSEDYIANDNVPYADLTPLEARFAEVPHRVLYEIPGICLKAEVRADREGGLVLLRSDGTAWDYTVPDAAAHSILITAPAEAIVTVNGAKLDPGEAAQSSVMPTQLTIPEELTGLLPGCAVYSFGGLYSVPEITAAMPDGTALAGSESSEGYVSFAFPGTDTLYAEVHERTESFLRELCEYGAGHTSRAYPGGYTVTGSEVSYYVYRAVSSLIWVQGVEVQFTEVTTDDYVPLGENAFTCRGHVLCHTKTHFQEKDPDLSYEMLWVRQNDVWLLQDLAFA